MCGRFTQHYAWRELVALHRLTMPAASLQPRYNIAPTMTVGAVVPRGGDKLELVRMRWGCSALPLNAAGASFPPQAITNGNRRRAASRPTTSRPPTARYSHSQAAGTSGTTSNRRAGEGVHDHRHGRNKFTRKFHDRMLVILSKFEPWAGWNRRRRDTTCCKCRPVSRKVNRVGNDSDARLIEAVQ